MAEKKEEGKDGDDPVKKIIVKFVANPKLHLARRRFFRNRYRDEAAHNLMCSAKATLLNTHPFLGFVAIDLPLIEEKELNKICGFKTAATDGYHIYYDAGFINSLSPKQVLFVVAHEIYHCVLNHTYSYGMMSRFNETMNKKLANIAMDYVVNAYLIENEVGEKPKSALYNPKYSGWSFEEVYDDLLEDIEGNSGLETLDQHVEIVFDEEGEEGSGESNGKSEGDEQGNGEGAGNCDGDGNGDNEGKAKQGSGKQCQASLTKKEYEEKNSKFIEGIQRAITQLSSMPDFDKGAGSVPAFLQRYVEHFRESKVNWKTALRNFFTRVVKRGYSFMRPNKKIQGGDLILPGYRKNDRKLSASIFFDLSGSVCDEQAAAFFSECKGVMQEFGEYSIHAACFDAEVIESSYQHITGDSKKADMNFKEYMKTIAGGGGTNFQSIWDFVLEKRLHKQSRVLIIFTDGYPCDTEWTKNWNVMPTIFVTVGNNEGWKAPFGKTIVYEDCG